MSRSTFGLRVITRLQQLLRGTCQPVGTLHSVTCTSPTVPCVRIPSPSAYSAFCVRSFIVLRVHVISKLVLFVHECSLFFFCAFTFVVDYFRSIECIYSVTFPILPGLCKWDSRCSQLAGTLRRYVDSPFPSLRFYRNFSRLQTRQKIILLLRVTSYVRESMRNNENAWKPTGIRPGESTAVWMNKL